MDDRTTGRHMSVAWVIIDRFMQKHGTGRASLRYIEKATGLSRHTVISACRELVDMGYFTRDPGVGTRPTEYTPKWLVVHPSAPLSSGAPVCTTSGEPVCTATGASGAPVCTESYGREPADKPASKESRNLDTHAAPTAPLSAGLSAADAVTARDPFDVFWLAYPRKYQKPKARAAWEKINPDAQLAERIVTAAGQWSEHYASNAVDKKWMPAPANWLAGERYDEDLPDVYVDPKETAIAKAREPRKSVTPSRGQPKKQEASLGLSKTWLPFGTHDAVIFATDFENRGDQDFKLHLDFRVVGGEEDGLEFRHTLPIVSMDEDEAVKANRQLADICRANDFVGPLEDSSDLRGFFVSIRKTATTGVEYARSAANNEMGVAA